MSLGLRIFLVYVLGMGKSAANIASADQRNLLTSHCRVLPVGQITELRPRLGPFADAYNRIMHAG